MFHVKHFAARCAQTTSAAPGPIRIANLEDPAGPSSRPFSGWSQRRRGGSRVAAVVLSRRPDDDPAFTASNRRELLRRGAGRVLILDADPTRSIRCLTSPWNIRTQRDLMGRRMFHVKQACAGPSLSQSLNVLTAATPTPCRPPDRPSARIAYLSRETCGPPPNLPPACSTVITSSGREPARPGPRSSRIWPAIHRDIPLTSHCHGTLAGRTQLPKLLGVDSCPLNPIPRTITSILRQSMIDRKRSRERNWDSVAIASAGMPRPWSSPVTGCLTVGLWVTL
jgi:hypothetical protein